ncbi:polysaccharide biosynthesis tyrosine autokinase [Leifsonia shinshuensis]|uniref:polysaccharide biosynthesis tyrosine autokinase n=1 Tax=Leifsonia shinshuensis TaxID=150026 RepID=UPI001F510FD8|nr:polysaccharide biosynthesis tyrosine autokinase [Leifsonia shinshuensis]MCI0159346.1 polysaccharide biosynthesis tyrosine autokinase [Leifsonia shinshuensis]
MNSKKYGQAFRRFWYVVVIATIVGAIAGYGLSQLATPVYTATSSLYFSLSFAGTATDLSQGATYTQNQMLSFAQLAESPAVLQPVIDDLNLAETPAQLASAITVSTPQNTVILQIAVADTSPKQAAAIANAVAANLSSTVEQIAPKSATDRATVTVRVIAHAAVPDAASSPNIRLNVLSGLLLGLIVGALIVVLRETFDTRVHNAETAVEVAKAPLVGSIPRERGSHPGLVLVESPLSVGSEAYRQLRSNLEFVTLGSPNRAIVVTSSVPGEGKSIISANVAMALAETGQRVLLIDADLRRPMIATYSGLAGAAGLTSVLAGRAEFEEVVQRWGEGELYVLASGPIPPNPSELLSSRRMADLLARLRTEYDTVVIDTAPLGSVADASILARQVDGALVVVDRTQVRRQQLAQTIDSLEKSGAAVLGIVLNRIHTRGQRGAYYTPEQPQRRLGLPTRKTGEHEAANAKPGAERAKGSRAKPAQADSGPLAEPEAAEPDIVEPAPDTARTSS